MLEITDKQLLIFDEINRVRILKYIASGLIKYKGGRATNEYNDNANSSNEF